MVTLLGPIWISFDILAREFRAFFRVGLVVAFAVVAAFSLICALVLRSVLLLSFCHSSLFDTINSESISFSFVTLFVRVL